jgi:cysteine desulfurase
MYSMQRFGYFDSAATTVLSSRALDVYQKTALDMIGNPSANHREGKRARALLESLRTRTATLLGLSSADTITFTGGASEANSIILGSLLWQMKPGHIILAGIEHSSVLEWERLLTQLGWKITLLRAPGGFVDATELSDALTDETKLVSIMMVNNVIGTIQDIPTLVKAVRTYESSRGGSAIHFHTDATQALTKIPVDLKALGVDSASFSAHKFHGPRGVGFLYSTRQAIQPLSRGGAQERGLRPGTEDLASIAAMVEALQEGLGALTEHYRQVTVLNQEMRTLLSAVPILTPPVNSSPYILTISLPPLPSEVTERIADDAGFCISAGSACSHNTRAKGSRSVRAMGISDHHAASSIRLSFSHENTIEEARQLAELLLTTYRKHAR